MNKQAFQTSKEASWRNHLARNWADVASREMDWTGLKLLLEGIEPKQVRRRYKKPVDKTQNTPVQSVKTLSY